MKTFFVHEINGNLFVNRRHVLDMIAAGGWVVRNLSVLKIHELSTHFFVMPFDVDGLMGDA
jgi:hypothetical protein